MKKTNTKEGSSLQALQQQVIELDNKWKRALADYQNLEKRTQQERSAFVKLATVPFLARLLPVIDDLDRAAHHLKDQGLDMVMKQFTSVLKEEGVVEIPALHQPFDPSTMECVEKKEGEVHSVIEVVQKGYMIDTTVLRPAKVIVGVKHTNE